MKNINLFFLFVVCTSFLPIPPSLLLDQGSASENVFVIISDGFRWQEVFNGADSALINDSRYTPDTASTKAMFWSGSKEERRKRLLPFFWNVIANKGQLHGNREYGSNVNTANAYALSYPGYSEMFTGITDPLIIGNDRKYNRNINVLEFLNSQRAFQDKIAVFSSWDVFPYILNDSRNDLFINSGYETFDRCSTSTLSMVNRVQEKLTEKSSCREDQLTFTMAKDYIRNKSPRIVVLALGETDEFAHDKRYDLYLQQANQFDKMVFELWNMVQTSPVYKGKTSFLITTDHGRGSRQWSKHGFFVNGSSQTWLALLGPNIESRGEIRAPAQYYNKQFAEAIANLVGANFRLTN